jgi:hypothetical protein
MRQRLVDLAGRLVEVDGVVGQLLRSGGEGVRFVVR